MEYRLYYGCVRFCYREGILLGAQGKRARRENVSFYFLFIFRIVNNEGIFSFFF